MPKFRGRHHRAHVTLYREGGKFVGEIEIHHRISRRLILEEDYIFERTDWPTHLKRWLTESSIEASIIEAIIEWFTRKLKKENRAFS